MNAIDINACMHAYTQRVQWHMNKDNLNRQTEWGSLCKQTRELIQALFQTMCVRSIAHTPFILL